MEAYKVWATLSIKGDAQKKMEQFSLMTKKASEQVSKLTKMLPSLNIHFEKMSAVLRTINPRLDALSISLVRLNTNATGARGSFSSFNNAISSGAGRMRTAAANAASLASSLNAVAISGEAAAASLGGVRGSRGGFGAGRGHGGGGLRGHLGGLMGLRFMGLSAGGIGAIGGAELLKSSFHTGLNYEEQMTQLVGQNIPGLNQSQANAYISGTPSMPGISKLGLLTSLTDAAVITKNASSAEKLAPFLAKFSLANQLTYHRGTTDKEIMDAVKVAEIMSGSKDPAVLQKYIDMMFQAKLSSAGRITSSTYLQASKSMRGYGKNIDPSVFFYGFEPMFQEYGQRTGTMIGSFYNHLIAGRLTTQGARMLGNLGLLNMNDVEKDKIGRVMHIKPGAIQGTNLLQSNPIAWIAGTLLPALQKSGYKTQDQQLAAIGKIFTNTDLTLVQTIIQQLPKIMLAMQTNARTATVGETLANQNKLTPRASALRNFNSAFTDFEKALDNLTSPAIVKTLNAISGLFRDMANGMNFLSQGNYHKALFGDKTSILGNFFDSSKNRYNNLTKYNPMFSAGGQNAPIVKTQINLNGNVLANAMSKAVYDTANTTVDLGQSGLNFPYVSPSTSTPFHNPGI